MGFLSDVEGTEVLFIVIHEVCEGLIFCFDIRIPILSYQVSEKETPFPMPILLRINAILISSLT